MAQVTSTICDGCGRVKSQTNNWYRLLVTPTAFCVYSHGNEAAIGRDGDLFDMCGQECAGKKLSEWMGQPAEQIPEPRPLALREVEGGT